MKTRKIKRWLSVILAIAFILGMIPAVHAQGSGGDELDDPRDIFDLDKQEPEQLDRYPDDVYGKNQNQPFLLSEQNELALIIGTEARKQTTVFDNFNLDMTSRDSGGNCWMNGIHPGNAENTASMTSGYPYGSVYDLQSIALDADGTGRKQYIASVGIEKTSKSFVLIVQNPLVKDSSTYTICSASEAWSFSEYIVDNCMAITAGDYDGDGKDSIILYAAGNGDNAKLYEFVAGTDKEWYGSEILNLSSVVKDTRYTRNPAVKYKPTVSLATGDFNGDGRDQLAFSAGFYNTSDDVRDGYMNFECDNLEQFATCVSIGDRTPLGGWDFFDPIWMYDIGSDYVLSGNRRTYPLTMMHGGVITAGDVNNDGIDEIVAAGYVSLTKDMSSGNYARAVYRGTAADGTLDCVSHVCDFSPSKLVSSVIRRSGNGYMKSPLIAFDMSTTLRSTFKEYCNDKDFVFTKLAMASGKTNGDNAPEEVFISGILYNFNDLMPEVSYKASFNDDEFTYLSEVLLSAVAKSSVNWVRAAAVGNFNGNEAGREQFVFTLWQKKEGDNCYTSSIGVIAGVEYQDKLGPDGNVHSFGPPKYHACSFDAEKYKGVLCRNIFNTSSPAGYRLLIHQNERSDHPLNAVPVAVDTDDDGVIGRFSKSGYVYTDPEVIAVLQAAPYFSELYKAGGYTGYGETRYGVSVGYGTGTSHGDNVSFEVGYAEEMSAGPLKAGLEAGYTLDWSHTYESSYTVTTSSTFTAEEMDVVLLTRIPVLIYTYDILNPASNAWIPNGINVRVPMTPRYYTLSIEDYNEFVDEYNKQLGKYVNTCGLNKIQEGVDMPMDHEGNPSNYWSSWASAGTTGKRLSPTHYSFSHSGGSMDCGVSAEFQETETDVTSHGFHFGLTIQLGGNYLAGEAWAGGYANLNYSHSTGHSTTKTTTTACGGTVQNVNARNVAGLLKEEVENGYSFCWEFGKWTRELTKTGVTVPFYGYRVFDVRHRALPPQIADWTQSVEPGYSAFSFPNLTSGLNADLTVSKVSGDSRITYDRSTKAIRVAAGLTAGTYTAVFNVSNGLTDQDTTFRFILKVGNSSGRWLKNANGWWYQRPDGTYPKNQWEKIGGKWYHFNDRGYMQTGWLKLSGKWYYLGTSGVMVTGWKQISGKWYWFSDGGVMATGWKQLSGKWYYFESSGAMATGWKTISGKTYYFKASGAMAAREWCGGYYLNADGTWTYQYKASWKQNAKGWWFGDTSGWYAKSCTITIDGKAYTFDAKGYWVK
ncbi:MAG: N-acetylmuramoyl-L-alanine amidase family protein [Lachnospiraceae bacterium]|nr:N-acetylmuramoyl-L-alanine amidase family protein [Lachnospiraceae bacterium]